MTLTVIESELIYWCGPTHVQVRLRYARATPADVRFIALELQVHPSLGVRFPVGATLSLSDIALRLEGPVTP